MTNSFRSAVESGDPAQIADVLHADVQFHSPAVFTTYRGREQTLVVLRAVFEVFEDFRYIAELRNGDDEMLRFTARVGDLQLEGVDLVRYGPDGTVAELTVMVRPLKALAAVAEAVGRQIAANARAR
ncbi:nuclear transport factor 2 family protein [Smaragdicoccus niigatensis]|uniref:nuclear transport factor 2 family protein n=1 Tax=Smaragdicoccus niigatensis TaxID=359359 RepID=UPI0003782049|nr:nuclear transport factor 2 family protein [Smaragdicoccus niigatensis]